MLLGSDIICRFPQNYWKHEIPLYQKAGLPGRTIEKGMHKQMLTTRWRLYRGLCNRGSENAQCDLSYFGGVRRWAPAD
jgi:hypothetical protein